ncbi:20704_t:CDS:2, partial [Funneliformis geosporum]
ILNPLDKSLKLEYRLDDNSSFISLYDLDINTSDTRREYVTFWNPLTNTNIYEQVTRKYSHGSLIHPTSNNCRIGISWICLNQQQSFCTSVTNWILSTRAEIFILLTTLIVSSKNSKVTLCNDSMATIHGFSSYISNNNFSV